jgi:DNA polymerase I
MKFQILDATYNYDFNGFPVIVLFGITENGTSITKRVTGFLPYFYIDHPSPTQAEKYLSALGDSIGIEMRFQDVKRFRPLGFQSKPRNMLKVTVKNPKDTKLLNDFCTSDGYTTYESDVLFADRFAIDHGISGAGWVITPDSPTISHEDIISVDEKKNAPLKTMAIDIETLPKDDGSFPTADVNSIVLISLEFDPQWRGQNNVVMVAKDIDCPRPDVICSDNEKDMLKKLDFIINEFDPDIVAGHNIVGFDIPYITDRAKILEVKLRMSRDGKPAWCTSFMGKYKVSIRGRIVLDTLPAIKAMDKYRLKSYSLKNVAKEILHSEKLDVKPGEMRALWEGSGINKFISYSRRDSTLVMMLVKQLGFMNKYFALSKASGAFLQVVVNGGQSHMIEARISRAFKEEHRVMGTKQALEDDDISEAETIKGAIVLDPKIGLTEDVVILDYKSLYPTIMMAYNLCYSTEIRDEQPPGDIITTPCGGKFVSQSTYIGIVPRILKTLLAERLAAKTAMKTAATPEEKDALDAKQYAMKILLNSIYGYSGYTRARLFSPIITNSVTAYGRENLLRTKSIVKEHSNFELEEKKYELEVVSGDSIVGDRCITIQENEIIKVIPVEELFNNADDIEIHNGKEYAIVSEMNALTHLGWKPINFIMRHFTTKKIYRVNQKFGESVTTEDHSFMDIDLNKTKPTEMQFTKMYRCNIPKSDKHITQIDLWEYVKDYKFMNRYFVKHENTIKLGGGQNTKISIQRFYNQDELLKLGILLCGYITEGSASFGSKIGSAICDTDVNWLLEMENIYHMFINNVKTCVIESQKKIRSINGGNPYKDETRKLQMMNMASAHFFNALCGHESKNKKLPDFIFNMESKDQLILFNELVRGDGYINISGHFEYSTTSTRLASGISTLLSILNVKYRTKFREDKHEYTIREWSGKSKMATHTNITECSSNCYVYDLSVEDAHTFVDSMGQILLHNTDSIFISIKGGVDFNIAKSIGKEIATIATAGLPAPMELVFEAFAKRLLIVAKKHYAMYRFETADKGIIKAKGIETVRRDWCNLTAMTLTKCLELILIEGNVDLALNHARTALQNVKSSNHTILKDLILSRTLTRNPENYNQVQPHAELMKKLDARGIHKYVLGDRIPFIIIKSGPKSGKRKQLMTSRAEDPEYVLEHNLPIDTEYYLQKQLIPPLTRIFSCFGISEMDLQLKSRQQTLFT